LPRCGIGDADHTAPSSASEPVPVPVPMPPPDASPRPKMNSHRIHLTHGRKMVEGGHALLVGFKNLKNRPSGRRHDRRRKSSTKKTQFAAACRRARQRVEGLQGDGVLAPRFLRDSEELSGVRRRDSGNGHGCGHENGCGSGKGEGEGEGEGEDFCKNGSGHRPGLQTCANLPRHRAPGRATKRSAHPSAAKENP
jgi:hypothetical protein